ncbi:MAG: MarR family transcriptional regulator [Elusimicrobium sp.]|uniref:MarR family transcriptional regulator n=1 Tax=Candidatus Avelusimicrobium gallicola TaxID=2562704 RepID=A0A928DRJ4_9BACT|nr:MarR family transcriptional regulator [Elusimicrobium sp.]
MKALHPKQTELLEILRTHISDPLTMEELAERLNVSGKSVVFHHIKQLEKKGYLKRNPANPRDYIILKDPERNVIYLKMYGMAKCGPEGTILDGTPTRIVPVDPSMIYFPACKGFMVEAKGNSMESLIAPHDWLIVEQSHQPQNKDVVVCVNNGEVMVKRFTQDGENVILQSENPSYNPIVADRDSFRVEGIVRSIIKRSFNC